MWHLWERGFKLKKGKKGEVISELREEFDKAKALIFTDFRGLTVAELSNLRKLLRNEEIKYKVIKNTLARIASVGTPVEAAKDHLRGPVGIVIGYDDPVLTAKKVLEYSKNNEKLKVNSGVIEGRFCASEEIKVIAELPSKKVLLSMIAGVFRTSLGKMAGALQATINSFAYAMNSLKQQKSKVES